MAQDRKCGVTRRESFAFSPVAKIFVRQFGWRNIAMGILSTTRFAGMLMAYGKRYVVYDIGEVSI